MQDNYLYHHGIKGQKWGVRRFQNEDGTYTNLGEQHRYKTPSMRDARKAYKSAVKRNNMQLGKDFDSAVKAYFRNYTTGSFS